MEDGFLIAESLTKSNQAIIFQEKIWASIPCHNVLIESNPIQPCSTVAAAMQPWEKGTIIPLPWGCFHDCPSLQAAAQALLEQLFLYLKVG